MKTLNAVLLAGVVFTLVPQTSDAMEKFLRGLPNGSKFKKTLGHKGENGFTPFGSMFSGTWSASLCKNKFPGSNITVGQAFGDPCCTWSEGTEPDFEVTFTDDFPAQSAKTCATTSGRAAAGIGGTSTSGGDAGAKASGESKSNIKPSSGNIPAQVGGTRKIHIPNLGGNKPPGGGGSPPSNGNSGGNGGGSSPPGGGNQPPGGAKPPPGGDGSPPSNGNSGGNGGGSNPPGGGNQPPGGAKPPPGGDGSPPSNGNSGGNGGGSNPPGGGNQPPGGAKPPPGGGGSPPSNGNSGGNGGGSNPPGGGNQPPGGAKPPTGGGNQNSSSGNSPSGLSAGKSGGGNKSSAGGKSRSFDFLRTPSFRGRSDGSLSPNTGVHPDNSATAGEIN